MSGLTRTKSPEHLTSGADPLVRGRRPRRPSRRRIHQPSWHTESQRRYLYLLATAPQDQRKQLSTPSVEMPNRLNLISAFCKLSIPVNHNSKRDAVCAAQLSMETPPPSQSIAHPLAYVQPVCLRNTKNLVSIVQNLPAHTPVERFTQTSRPGKRQLFPGIGPVVPRIASSQHQPHHTDHNHRTNASHNGPNYLDTAESSFASHPVYPHGGLENTLNAHCLQLFTRKCETKPISPGQRTMP